MARKTNITICRPGTPLTPRAHLPVSLTDNGIFLAYPLDNVEVCAPTLVELTAEVERVVREADATPRERAYVHTRHTQPFLTEITAPITRTDARGNTTTAQHYAQGGDWLPITTEHVITPWTEELETALARFAALRGSLAVFLKARPFTPQDVEVAIQAQAAKIRADIQAERARLRAAGVADVE